VADLGWFGGDAGCFFDDPEYLRIALAERTDAESRREARDAARLARSFSTPAAGTVAARWCRRGRAGGALAEHEERPLPSGGALRVVRGRSTGL
jgi:hypothetical protein